MKILLFGGAFDPVHIGHINLLKTAVQHFSFDKIIIMPTGTPAHKNHCITPFEIRKHMAELAFADISDNIEISDYEGNNLQQSYTWKTLEHLENVYPKSEKYLLIGSDSLINFTKWAEFRYILKQCTLICLARNEKERKIISSSKQLLQECDGKVEILYGDILTISSSDIRLLSEKSEKVEAFVPQNVALIINKFNLYSRDDYKRWTGTSQLLVQLMLPDKRQIHTNNVKKLSVQLAKIHKADVNKALICALLHDILKYADDEILLHRAEHSDIINKISLKPKQTLHGYAAADFACKELNIQDEDMLNAIKSHTCGRAGMSKLEKIIYLADMLCEERKFSQKEFLLDYAYKNLDMAMYLALKQSILWLKENNKTIDKDSLIAFNYFEKIIQEE